MPFNFDKPVKFTFKLVLDPDGAIHSFYSSSPRGSMLFHNTYESFTNLIDYLAESIVLDFANSGEIPKNKED